MLRRSKRLRKCGRCHLPIMNGTQSEINKCVCSLENYELLYQETHQETHAEENFETNLEKNVEEDFETFENKKIEEERLEKTKELIENEIDTFLKIKNEENYQKDKYFRTFPFKTTKYKTKKIVKNEIEEKNLPLTFDTISNNSGTKLGNVNKRITRTSNILSKGEMDCFVENDTKNTVLVNSNLRKRKIQKLNSTSLFTSVIKIDIKRIL